MSAEVKILIKGYTNADSVAETGEEKTCPTISLVRDKGLIMVVDPGVLADKNTLVGALEAEDLCADDVNMVCITHSHIDHYRNLWMFPNAKVLEHFGIWNNDTVEEWHENLTEHIQILRTPGHDYTGITLLVDTLEHGKVAVCGDVFWKENYPEEDMYATDKEKLKESREMILKMADWIVPGHGNMYRVKRGLEEPHKTIVPATADMKNKFVCKRCHKVFDKKERCLCRPWLCWNCCECGLDCDLCGCSHKRISASHHKL